MKQALQLIFLLATGLAVCSSISQTYPNRPVRIVVPSSPGGSSDVAARLIASELDKRLVQSVIVENRSGGGQSIAASVVAKAAPDGYTLFFAGILSPHPIFMKNNPVDASRDLAPVSNLLSFGALCFIVSAKLTHTTFQDILVFSKANPGKLNYANTTPAQELAMAMLKHRTGLSNTLIPYKADSQVVTAFKAGEVDLAMPSCAPYLRYIQDGTVRVLFVAAQKRSPLFPDVPTAPELGVPNFEVAFNSGFWAPAGTPRDIIQKLNTESNAVVKMATLAERLRNIGAEPLGSTPEEQLRIFEADVRFFAEAARLANYRPE